MRSYGKDEGVSGKNGEVRDRMPGTFVPAQQELQRLIAAWQWVAVACDHDVAQD